MQRSDARDAENQLSTTGDEPERAESLAPREALTLREREVLRGLARGLNPKEIADVIGSSAKTVQNQISQVKEKLGIREPAGLILYAQKHGLVPVG